MNTRNHIRRIRLGLRDFVARVAHSYCLCLANEGIKWLDLVWSDVSVADFSYVDAGLDRFREPLSVKTPALPLPPAMLLET